MSERLIPPAPDGVPAEMTITLPSDDIAVIHGMLAADGKQMIGSGVPRAVAYGQNLHRIARAIDHQANAQIHEPPDQDQQDKERVMGVRDLRLWTCDVGGCEKRADRPIRPGGPQSDERHELPLGWVSVSVHSIRGHHNVSKWLCPDHACEHIMPMFPEYANQQGGPEPVRFKPPLTRAEADAFWNAITDQTESPDQDQPDRSGQ